METLRYTSISNYIDDLVIEIIPRGTHNADSSKLLLNFPRKHFIIIAESSKLLLIETNQRSRFLPNRLIFINNQNKTMTFKN